MNDVSFSPAEIGLITALLAALSTPVAILYFSLRSSYLARIADHREALIESRRRNDELRPALEKQTDAIREQSALIRDLISRREVAR